jgi:hypothetical protein
VPTVLSRVTSWTLAAAALGLVACSSASSGAGAGASATPTVCTYPAGPYGTNEGDVVDPSLTWQGYVGNAGTPSTVSIASYYDCDGTHGVRALLLDESATWCSDCEKEAATISPLVTGKWQSEGVSVVVLMAQDQSSDPATLGTAQSWRNEYVLTTGAVCADPSWTMKLWGGASASGNGFPTNAVIDPRTMKIVALQPLDVEGTVENLAAANR